MKKQPVIIRTPDHRLRVFVSSTLKELAEERLVVHEAIGNLRLVAVMFESGARPHPAHEVYHAYLSQSHIFVGIYWQKYGWVAPGMGISGLEDEYDLSAGMPRLFYIKTPAPDREPGLSQLLGRIGKENSSTYKYFSTPEELRELVENDLALLLAEYFESARGEVQVSTEVSLQPPSNVPTPRNLLVGRDRELDLACELLKREDVALITLTGPGGVGKSRLGIEIALAMRDRFPDGVYMVGLESVRDETQLIPTIAKALSVTDPGGDDLPANQLKGYFCNKRVLVMLDNFEQVMSAATKVGELLESCPAVKSIITSRAPLRLRAERELPVPPLAIPPIKEKPDVRQLAQYPAVQLFIQRAQSVRPDFQVTAENASAVAEICNRLEGLPLAIELAAARIKILTPQVLLSRLGRRFDVLRDGTRDLPERHRTLYSAIDWSYSLLSDEDKILLQRLSVFAGGWTLDEAETICKSADEGPIDVFRGLVTLVENNLILSPEEIDGELRFKMLESIGDFAHERLSQSDEVERLHNLHGGYFLALAERTEIELRESFPMLGHRKLELESDNLRAAMSWMLGQGKNTLALRIAISLWRFWWTNGQWGEGLGWLKSGLAGPEAIPVALKAKALTLSGWLSRFLGDLDQARAFLQEGLVLWQQTGDLSGRAMALSNLGATVLRQGEFGHAMALLDEALNLARQQGDLYGMYTTLEILGHAASRQGDSEKAIRLFNEALTLAETAKDDIQITKLLNDLGDQYILKGDYEQAEGCFSRAAIFTKALSIRSVEAYISGNRGIIAMKKGDYAKASELLVEALMIWRELGDKEEAILCLETIAVVAKEQGNPEKATRLLGATEVQRKAIGVTRALPIQEDYTHTLADLRSQLGEEVFQAAWIEGSQMPYDQVLLYGLDRLEI